MIPPPIFLLPMAVKASALYGNTFFAQGAQNPFLIIPRALVSPFESSSFFRLQYIRDGVENFAYRDGLLYQLCIN